MSTETARRARFEVVAGDVFEPLQRYLRRRAPAEDAADAFGDAMLTIWRRIDDVPADDPLPWCYGVARRTLANQRRSATRRLRLVDRVAASAPSDRVSDPQATVDDRDPELTAALRVLTDSEAEIVRLWAWESLEPNEIATVLAMTPNAVSVALSRARRKLRVELESHRDRQESAIAGQEQGEAITDTDGGER